MFKNIIIKLSKVKYAGNSIGRDIRVETEIFDKFFSIDKRIKASTIAEVNSEIGRFETDKKFFITDVKITVIEKDLFFNDIGNTIGTIKISTTTKKPQQFIFEVQVKETRLFGFWGKRNARFEILLEAEISDTIKYVPDEDKLHGWLAVRLEDDKSVESLPAYLKVKVERVDARREYFTILEGPYRCRPASVRLRDNGSSWFFSGVRYESMVRARYSISQKTFIVGGKKYKTVDYPEVPWRKGLYDIEIPDYPHQGGRKYLNQSKRAMIWFKIGHSGERYLHAGGRSLGCITVIETKTWTKIYSALIKARKGDFMSVGVLEVVD